MNLQSTRLALALVATAAFGFGALTPTPVSAADPATSGDGALSAEVLFAPSPFIATDKLTHLVYEIALENVSSAAVQVDDLEVIDPRRDEVVLAIQGDAIFAVMISRLTGPTNALAPGEAGMVYLDVTFDRHARVPSRLIHRFGLAPTGDQVGAATDVVRHGPLRLEAPLRGSGLLAVNGCCSESGHARQLVDIGDRVVVPQRYAIDFIQIEDGSPFGGDPTLNESYFVYGDDILAAAPGRVIETRDGMADNAPGDEPPGDFATAGGNYVLVALGGGRYAFYAHMIPGSVSVDVGDRVIAGQVLGHVGNSGASSEPHLHFHVADAPSALFSNGVPYVFKDFQLEARVIGLETGNPSIVPAEPPLTRRMQLPLNYDIVAFPPG